MADNEVRCGSCGGVLNERSDLPLSNRVPCLRCGSMQRAFSVFVVENMETHESIGIKHKDKDGKTLAKMKSGDDFYHKKKEWRKLDQVIDYMKGRYRKTVRDRKTDKVLYFKDEPLEKHIGHGRDRKLSHRIKRRIKELFGL